MCYIPSEMGRSALLLSSVLLLAACDFGTLADLSTNDAEQGTDESGQQALAIWRNYDVAKSDDDVKTAIATVDQVVDRAGSKPVQVKILGLTQDDVRLVGLAADPAAAQGILLITELDCPLAQVEKLVIAKNQTTIYPGLYDKYERTYTSDVNAFLGGANTVSWTTAYTATALSRTYNANLHGGARYVKGANPLGGDVLLSRTVLDAPAIFTSGDDAAFNQDYQIELYYERVPGKTIHFYGLWREFKVGGLTSKDDLYVNVVLGNLVDADTRTSKVCRENNPQPTFQ